MIYTIFSKFSEFRRNSRMSRGEIEALQLRKFRKLVQHAQESSPYYRQLIQAHDIDAQNCTPADFPILAKSDLIEHFDEIVTDRRLNKKLLAEFLTRSTDPNELLLEEYRVTHTSGSSGEVGYFVFSKSDWGRGIAQMRRHQSIPFGKTLFRRLRIAYFGATRGHFGGVSMMTTSQQGVLRLRYRLSLSDVNDPLPEVITQLNNYQPDQLAGYTTALTILAEKQLAGELKIAPYSVVSSGEAQSSADRELLARAFSCEVGSSYGCTEHLMMGRSRPDGQTMVLFDDDLMYEFGSDHTIVTNLFNFTLPLIRYRMSDELRLADDQQSAGPYLLVSNLIGRSEIVPRFLNCDGQEDFISPFVIIELFIPGVSRFQMRITGREQFDFAVCLDKGLTSKEQDDAILATQRRLREMLAQKGMDNVKFNVVVVDQLPINEQTGKFQLIVQSTPTGNGA